MTGVRINSKEENQRQYAVIDQMLTMHSLLRDRMERRAFWLNTALVGSALFLAVFSFIGDEFLRKLGLNPDWTRFVLGLAGVVALICSITEYRVDWRTISGKHADAAARLGALKVTFRKSFSETLGNDDVKNAELSDNYEQTVNSLPTIPDRWFNSLKAEHRFKRQLSETLDLHPSAPVWFLAAILRIRGICQALSMWSK